MSIIQYREDQAELYLELGHVSLYYMQYGSAKVHVYPNTCCVLVLNLFGCRCILSMLYKWLVSLLS